MAKAKNTQTPKKPELADHKQFIMIDSENNKFIVFAPNETLDEEGHAEEALSGEYRTC